MRLTLTIQMADHPDPAMMRLVLKDNGSNRLAMFPIAIDDLLELILVNHHLPHPNLPTYEGWMNTIQGLGGNLVRVHIESADPKNGLATQLIVAKNDIEICLRCNPSDALCLKSYAQVPLTCEEETFTKFNLITYNAESADLNAKLAVSELLHPDIPKA